jgi:NAD+ kinase
MLRSSRISLMVRNPDIPWRVKQVPNGSTLGFNASPRRVLIAKKYNDTRSRDAMINVCNFLSSRGAEILIDESDPDRVLFEGLKPVSCAVASSMVDFVVCLGGDGTVLRTISWVGECSSASGSSFIPPVLAFGVGSLGFLAPFSIADYKAVLSRILDPSIDHPVTLRTRLRCEVYDPNSTTPKATHRVLNECLVARGSHSAFQHLDCKIDGMKVAQFQADGLIVATPSGSSAYSMAAGGPLVAPNVPCILLTPVAPHALSARPLVLPGSSDIEVHVPKHARSRPIVSFDGHHEMVLERDSRVRITQSKSFVPFFRLTGNDTQSAGPSSDWFVSLRSKLLWAKEVRQAAL